MNSIKFIRVLFYLVLLIGPTAMSQKTQSAIYDAIALMNAKHDINVIMIPDAVGYSTIDPLTGEITSTAQTTPLSDNYKKTNDSHNIILKILARNANLPDTSSTEEIMKAYKGNPFLEDILTSKNNIEGVLKDEIIPLSTNSLAGSTGTKILNNIANGTADFLIKRANEELTVSVIQKLKDFTTHYQEFEVLFPRTMNLIKPIAPYDYSKTLNALKSALQEDLDQLVERLPQLYSIPRYQEINKKLPLITMIFTATQILNDLNGSKNISSIIHNLDTCAFLSEENNYAGFVRILILTSDNLRKKTLQDDDDGDYNYITSEEIESVTNANIFNKAQLTKYFLGLLYKKSYSIPFWTISGKKMAPQLLSDWATLEDKNIGELFNKLSVTIDKIEKLGIQINKIKDYDNVISQTNGKVLFSKEKYIAYNQIINTAVQLCEPFVSGPNADTPFKKEFKRVSTYWPGFSEHIINMINALSQKQYSLAVDDLGQILEIVSQYMEEKKLDPKFKSDIISDYSGAINKIEKEKNDTLNSIKKQIEELATLTLKNPKEIQEKIAIYDQQESLLREKAKIEKELAELEWQKDNTEKFLFTLSKVTEYYKLFAALSQAESGAEVEALLESYALPSGSSRIKKETDFNIAVNAYVGGFFARSKTEGAGFSNQYGLTAPIGFTISHGLESYGSLSLFAGIFDIGGIIRYKLDNEGKYQQDVNLAGIVSPSIHGVYGFPFYLPLSIGLGCQWTTPVTTANNNINLKPHFNMFLAVDIPLFNLKVSRKKIKPYN